jgi:hypothetical protein
VGSTVGLFMFMLYAAHKKEDGADRGETDAGFRGFT